MTYEEETFLRLYELGLVPCGIKHCQNAALYKIGYYVDIVMPVNTMNLNIKSNFRLMELEKMRMTKYIYRCNGHVGSDKLTLPLARRYQLLDIEVWNTLGLLGYFKRTSSGTKILGREYDYEFTLRIPDSARYPDRGICIDKGE